PGIPPLSLFSLASSSPSRAQGGDGRRRVNNLVDLVGPAIERGGFLASVVVLVVASALRVAAARVIEDPIPDLLGHPQLCHASIDGAPQIVRRWPLLYLLADWINPLPCARPSAHIPRPGSNGGH